MLWPEWLWAPTHPPTEHEDSSTEPKAEPPAIHASTVSTSIRTRTWNDNLNAIDWSHYTSPQTLTACTLTSLATLALVRLYKTYLRRIPTVEYLKPGLFGKRSLYGYVSRVGDGDNFHLFHTPGGRLAGWGWFPGRRVQDFGGIKGKSGGASLKGKTLHIRLAGVDAPEMGHFGHPAQPWGAEAKEWLSGYLLGRYVRAYAWRRDQYDRVVCTVYRRSWIPFLRSDVGEEMLKRGLATVYEANTGAEFGGKEERYREMEKKARDRGLGMWKEPGLVERLLVGTPKMESPREYKTRIAKSEKQAKGK